VIDVHLRCKKKKEEESRTGLLTHAATLSLLTLIASLPVHLLHCDLAGAFSTKQRPLLENLKEN
jgi:hypothetical protein